MRPESKLPLVKWADIDTPDTQQVAEWWQRRPDASIGVLCGPSGLVVIDVDDPSGLGALPGPLPATAMAATGRDGGRHYVYRDRWKQGRIRNSVGYMYVRQSKVETSGVDVRASGGLFIAPPSLHKTGRRYEWLTDQPPALAPAWLTPAPLLKPRTFETVSSPQPERLNPLVSVLEIAKNGERHNTAFWCACRAGEHVATGAVSEAEAFQILFGAAETVGLPASEAALVIERGLSIGHASVTGTP